MSKFLESLGSVVGAQFARFTYTAKGTGEVASYLVNLGVDIEKVYTNDLATLDNLIPTLQGIERVAAEELRDSIKKSLTVGIGNNPDATSAHAYTSIDGVRGLKVHNETGHLHLLCMLVQKDVIQEGTHKEVRSSEKTIAKRKIERLLRRSKIRQFILPNISRAALRGEVLDFT
jgi:hypothetical protein